MYITFHFFYEITIKYKRVIKFQNIGAIGKLRTTVKNFSAIKGCTVLGGSLMKIVTFGTKRFVRFSRHVRYWEVSLYLITKKNLASDQLKLRLKCLHFLFLPDDFAKQKGNPIFAG